jgi:site-specific DNA-methyltransferase (adenine-specific)
MKYELYNGDCLEVMDKLIEKGVKVDYILTDPPYGTTTCKWDSVIPFDDMWRRVNKLIKDDGAIVLFGSQPFTSLLVASNIKNFRYEIIWEKEQAVNFAFQKKQIGKVHENICVFYQKQPTYNPQMREGFKPQRTGSEMNVLSHSRIIGGRNQREGKTDRYPISVVKFNRDRLRLHPTCKPIKLLEFLIKTYTDENETVLDFTMGSGSTGVACMNTNRQFIGIELDKNYFEIAEKRIKEADKNA